MEAWGDILFFEGEDPEALKADFIRTSAQHQNRYSPYEVAQYVFRNLRDKDLRAGHAAQVWGNDLAVKEAIREAMVRGAEISERPVTKQEIQRRLLKVADDAPEYKDRVSALAVLAKMCENDEASTATSKCDLLEAIASKLPS